MATGSIIQRLRNDTQKILQGAFSVELQIVANYSGFTFIQGLEKPYVDDNLHLFTHIQLNDLNNFTIQGLTSKHRETYDPDTGLPIIGKNIHCSFSETALHEIGYAARKQNGNIIVRGWLVSFEDSVESRQYKIEEPEPDETVGLIRCKMGDYGTY